jgi:hypothetical protein
MEKGGWYEVPEWLMEEEKWPEQPDLRLSSETQHEEKPIRKIVSFFGERQHDEFDEFLVRRIYWSTIRITAWILGYKYNLLAMKSRIKKRRGPLTADEMLEAQNCWIWREQKYVPHDLEQPVVSGGISSHESLEMSRANPKLHTCLSEGWIIREEVNHVCS